MPAGGLYLTWVGNAAPPMPTRPARWISATNSSADSSSGAGAPAGRWGTISWVEKGSASISIAATSLPAGWVRWAMALTVPVTGAWRVMETKPPASATTWPRSTRSPTWTTGLHGAPVCWESGRT